MTTRDQRKIDGARRKYEAALARLATAGRGNRHHQLYPAAILGLYARLGAEQIETDLFDAGGYGPGDRGEIRETIRKAEREATIDPVGDFDGDAAYRRPAPRPRELTIKAYCAEQAAAATPAERAFVRSMIAAGADKPQPTQGATAADMERDGYGRRAADLIAASPEPIPSTPGEQAAAQILLMGADWRWPVWAGDGNQAKNPAAVRDAAEWADAFRKGERVPPLACINQVTGEAAHGGTFRNDSTVAAWRHIRIEFDDLPLSLQAAFWLGAWRTQALPIRAVTFSGGKSLHALLRIEECPDRVPGTQPNGQPVRETSNAADLDFYRRQWGTVARALSSDPEAALRCDLNAPNPSSMMRLAGHLRTDYKGGRHAPTWQRLLLITPPDLENDQLF